MRSISGDGGGSGDDDAAPEPPAARRAYFPSSIGLSLLVSGSTDSLEVEAYWGDYLPEPLDAAQEGEDAPAPESGGHVPIRWRRRPRRVEMTIPLPRETKRAAEHDVPDSGGLRVAVLGPPRAGPGHRRGDGPRRHAVGVPLPGQSPAPAPRERGLGRAVRLPGGPPRPVRRAPDPPPEPQGPRHRRVGRARLRPPVPGRVRVCGWPWHLDPRGHRRRRGLPHGPDKLDPRGRGGARRAGTHPGRRARHGGPIRARRRHRRGPRARAIRDAITAPGSRTRRRSCPR